VIARVWVMLPDVPLTVIVAVPVEADELAVNVSVLLDADGLGLKLAVTPLGKPLAERVTFPVKPLEALMLMVLVPLVP